MNITHSTKSFGSKISSGVKQVFMVALVLSLSLTMLHAQNNNDFCTDVSSEPGFAGDEFCESAVCEIKPECCTEAWDEECADIAASLSGIEQPCYFCASQINFGPFCDEPQEFTGFPDDPLCQQAVCNILPKCCDPQGDGWDEDCAQLAQDLAFGEGQQGGSCSACVFGEGPPPPGDSVNMAVFCDEPGTGPGFPGNLECEAVICADDPFCCNVFWDGLCAGDAALVDECITCRADYVAPPIPTHSQWGLIILSFLLLQGIWFTAVFKPTTPLKVIPAMWLEGLSFIKDNIDWFLPLLLLTTLLMALLYFAGIVQGADILGAPLSLVILAPSLYWYGKMAVVEEA